MKKLHFNEKVNFAYEEPEEVAEDIVLFTDTVCLYTGNDKAAISNLGREASGCMVLDCACTSTVGPWGQKENIFWPGLMTIFLL